MVAGIAFRSTVSEGELGVGMSGVNVARTVAGSDETDGMSPHALSVTVPALMPINLMKSLRVILFFEIIFVLRLLYYSMAIYFSGKFLWHKEIVKEIAREFQEKPVLSTPP